MEFDELKQIWDAQNNQPLYVIDEQALHNRILSKLRGGYHITSITELLLLIVNLGSGIFILAIDLSHKQGRIYMYLTAAWMFLTFIYILVSRIRRIRGNHRFDRSLHGDLEHAISIATYQVRLSQVMRWNILPIAALVLLSLWEGQKPIRAIVGVGIVFTLAYYVSGWEHGIYKRRKRELQKLQGKLAQKDFDRI